MATDTSSTHLPRNVCELIGVVCRIVWCADDSSHVIAKLYDGTAVKGGIDGDGLELDTAYRFLGRWEEHPQHGRQFAFSTFVRDTPLDTNGIIKYLADECPGVGKKRAADLALIFGASAVEMVRTRPDKIAASGILNHDQAVAASAALAKLAAFERTKIDLFGLFTGRGFHGKLVPAAIRKWGAKAATIVRRDPFKLLTARLPSAGFRRCDKLYLDLGNPAHRLKRQMFVIWNALRSDSNGHTWIEAKSAARDIEATIGRTLARPKRAMQLGKRVKWLASWKDERGVVWLAEAEKARAEWRVSESVRRLNAATPDDCQCQWPTAGFKNLTPHQADSIASMLVKPLVILAGSPGTGKTFSAASVIRQLAEQYGTSSILVCAPTGKASVRITDALRNYQIKIEATTIHRALGIGRNGHDGQGWGFIHNLYSPLQHKFVVVDETSMIDTSLLADLLEACGDGTHVLLIGDPHQLPPVGHGAPLRDLLASGAVPSATLTEIQRNAGRIVHACAAIKDGRQFEVSPRFDPEHGENLRHIETATEEQTVETLLRLLAQFRNGGKYDAIWQVQVIVAVNAKSKLARLALNKVLQGALNPNGITVTGNPFRVDDKLICLKNQVAGLVQLKFGFDSRATDSDSFEPEQDFAGSGDREEFIANGEIGRVLAVSAKKTIVRFVSPDRTICIKHGKVNAAADATDDGASKNVDDEVSTRGPGCDYDLAYAVTGHKMQGSEAQVILIPVDSYAGAKRIACREWWYTAISRARQLCVLVGNRNIVDAGCRKVSLARRKTFLTELLKGGTPT